jgi:hypothetical protein
VIEFSQGRQLRRRQRHARLAESGRDRVDPENFPWDVPTVKLRLFQIAMRNSWCIGYLAKNLRQKAARVSAFKSGGGGWQPLSHRAKL